MRLFWGWQAVASTDHAATHSVGKGMQIQAGRWLNLDKTSQERYLELSQRIEIPLEAEQVWRSLNDPAILKQCLPGCELFEPISDNKFNVTMMAKVGPVKARFKGEVELIDVNPPISYTLRGTGKGGVAGFVKGSAMVRLEEKAPAVTLMTYSVKANVGGKLAQLGTRLVAGASRKLANDFFTNFVCLICDDPEGKLEINLETIEDA